MSKLFYSFFFFVAVVAVVSAAPNAGGGSSSSNNNDDLSPPKPCLPRSVRSEAELVRNLKSAHEATLLDSSAPPMLTTFGKKATTAVAANAACQLTAKSHGGVAFPLPSAVTLGLARGPSPLHFDAYKEGSAAAQALPEFLSFLHMPLVALVTLGQGALHLLSFGRLFERSPQLDRMMELIARTETGRGTPTTMSTTMFRTVTDVSLKSNKAGFDHALDLHDKIVDVAVVPLPKAFKQCSDFTAGAVAPADWSSPQCEVHGQLAFRSLTAFVNSLIRFWMGVFGLAGEKKTNNGGVVACTVDTTVHSHTAATQCLFVRCASVHGCHEHQPEVAISHRIEVDLFIPMALLLGAVALSYLRPFFTNSAVLRWLLCSVFGIFVLFLILTILTLKMMKDNRMAQMGVLAGMILSGTYAAAQGIIFHALQFLVQSISQNVYALVTVALLCVGVSYLAHHYFGSAIPWIVWWSMLAGQVFLALAAFTRNREFCFFVVAMYFAARLIWTVVKSILRYFFGSLLWFDADAPRDAFPSWVSQEKEYVAPTVVNPVGFGMSHAQKMSAYDKAGKRATEIELRKLMQTIRSDPGKYANRLVNPNDVYRWAGVGQED